MFLSKKKTQARKLSDRHIVKAIGACRITLLNIFIIFQQNCILLNSILRDEIFSQKPIEYGYEITDLLAWLAASLLPTFRYRCDCCVFFPHYSAD